MVPMTDDEELEKLRQKRLAQLEMEQQYQEAVAGQQQAAEQEMEARRAAVLRQILSPEARERLGTLRTAHPELAVGVEDQLISLAHSGRLEKQVTDADLRRILRQVAPQKREINITFKK